MDSQNPYQTPKHGGEISEHIGPVRFVGGWPLIVGIGLACGAAIGVLFYFPAIDRVITPLVHPLFLIGLIWFGALLAVMFALKGIATTTSAKVVAAVAATPVAYFLYATTCSFSSMVMGMDIYGARPHIPATCSVFCFCGCLCLYAHIVRQRAERRHQKTNESRLGDDSDPTHPADNSDRETLA